MEREAKRNVDERAEATDRGTGDWKARSCRREEERDEIQKKKRRDQPEGAGSNTGAMFHPTPLRRSHSRLVSLSFLRPFLRFLGDRNNPSIRSCRHSFPGWSAVHQWIDQLTDQSDDQSPELHRSHPGGKQPYGVDVCARGSISIHFALRAGHSPRANGLAPTHSVGSQKVLTVLGSDGEPVEIERPVWFWFRGRSWRTLSARLTDLSGSGFRQFCIQDDDWSDGMRPDCRALTLV